MRKVCWWTRWLPLLLICSFVLAAAPGSAAYSVLTHEEIIDLLWDQQIVPLLKARFPNAIPDDLKTAHAYAYGGSVIQDIGYYPFGDHTFSDLTHYVRTGDFVQAMLSDAQDLNEYAFALGALAHYAGDNNGHRLGTNVAVPVLYPDLRRKFGGTVTYWDNPLSHLRTEFGFDVLQVAQGRYANDQFRKFIGFKVSKPVLERAFADTYGIELKDIFKSLDLALGTYRYSTSTVIPGMTKVAWQLKKDTFIKEIPGITKKKFLYNLSRSSYEKDFGKTYQRPGFETRLISWILHIVPKSGPFKSLAFKAPTPEVEKMFMASFNATVDSYRALLANVAAQHMDLVTDENIDLGAPTVAGGYLGADLAYDKLLDKLAEHKFVGVSAELRSNMLDYYKDRKPPVAPATAKTAAAWEKVMQQRTELEQLQPQTAATQ